MHFVALQAAMALINYAYYNEAEPITKPNGHKARGDDDDDSGPEDDEGGSKPTQFVHLLLNMITTDISTFCQFITTQSFYGLYFL